MLSSPSRCAASLLVAMAALPCLAQPLPGDGFGSVARPAPLPDWGRRPRLVEGPWDGREPPPGAVLTRKPDQAFIIAGSVTIGLGYLSFLTVAIAGNFVPALRDPTGLWNGPLGIEVALVLPVAAPALGGLSLLGTAPGLAWCYLTTALVQVAGVALIVAGNFWPVRRLMKPEAMPLAVLPGAAGAPLGATVVWALP